MYELGIGVELDLDKAIYNYETSAYLGLASGQYAYGRMLYHGTGVQKDMVKAFELFLKSAEQGYGYAQQQVGNMYWYGEGVDEDKKLAEQWLRLANNNTVYESLTYYSSWQDLIKKK